MSERTNTEPASVWRKHKELSKYVGRQGTIKAFTKIYYGPAGLVHRAPYYTAVIHVPDLSTDLVLEVVRDNDQAISTGKQVEMVVRRNKLGHEGLIQYSIKARVI